MSVNRNASLDAIVIGSGLNGLSAAIRIARARRSVRVYEAQPTPGGSARSMPLTLPGFTHDWGATVVALALASPFLRSLNLEKFGLEFVHPDVPFAHPLDDGSAAIVMRSIDDTVANFSAHDARAYRRIVTPFVTHADDLMSALLGPLGLKHPLLMAHFGLHAVQPLHLFAERTFESEAVRAVFAGVGAHSMLALTQLSTTGYALGLIISAHAYGWPVARGGSQQLVNAMVACLQSLGGEVVTNSPVTSLRELPDSRAILCDMSPRQLIVLCGEDLPGGYRERLEKFEHGPGVFKMDWALNAPVPWKNAACARAGTVHVGGTLNDITQSEHELSEGRAPNAPYVLTVQATPFDNTRAPAGMHTLWAYSHVPNGSSVDMRERIENQIERFAPGFRDCIVGRSVLTPAQLQAGNANLIGGDIGGGAGTLSQIFARPIVSLDPYATAMDGVYICSASTPPGIGVHGMSGFHAAESALNKSINKPLGNQS